MNWDCLSIHDYIGSILVEKHVFIRSMFMVVILVFCCYLQLFVIIVTNNCGRFLHTLYGC